MDDALCVSFGLCPRQDYIIPGKEGLGENPTAGVPRARIQGQERMHSLSETPRGCRGNHIKGNHESWEG